nr:DNA-directed DNA polymerase [Tanacetum cinerariifolium]
LQIIENKSKGRYSRNKPNVSRMNTTSRENANNSDDRIDKLADQISTLVDIFAKKIVTPAPVKAVEESCVTCGGNHAYYNCPNTDSNQPSVCVATGTYNQLAPQNRASNFMAPPGFAPNQSLTLGTLPSNTIPNPKGEMKAITTRSGVAYEGPSIPTPKKVVERETKETTDKEQSNVQGSTAHIQPPVTPISEPDVPKTLPKPNIPYPSRLNDQKLLEKATNQMEKFFQIFQDLHFDISFADALILMPKFASTIKSLLTNIDKLFELAKIPLNENFSAMLLKKLPEKLEDPGKFLIPCDFPGMDMTLELADRSITRPKRVVEDVFVKVGKFHFPTDFVVVDFEADPRVPLILGRSFLRIVRALIDVYGEEITLWVNDEAVTFNLNQTTRYSSTYDDLSVNQIDIIDVAREEYAQEILGFSNNSSGGNPTSTFEPILSDSSLSLIPFEGSDFILKEIDAYLKDESVSPEINHADCDPEGDICLIEKLLNDDPFQLPPMDLKQGEVVKAKSSIEEPPELELKERSNRRRVPNIFEPEIRTIEEIVPMADRTIEELLQAPTEGDVPNNAIKLMLFPYSLEGAARIWYEKEPPNLILTWDDLVNQLFPPSKTIHLKNKISCFTQRFEETFGEACDCFEEMLRALPNNHIQQGVPNEFSSYMKSNEIMIKSMQNQINVLRGDFYKQEKNLRRNLNNDMRSILGSFFQNQPSTSGTLPSNTVPNPKGEMKVVTTRSGLAYEGLPIPTNSPLEKVDEQNTEEIMDKEHSNCPGSTAQVQPPVMPISFPEHDVPRTQPKHTIPYPSRINDQKLRKKATNQMEKIVQIFHDFHFDISFADALLLMPKFASSIKSLLTNKDKLFELAKVPLNENCSAMLLKKLPEKLGDPGKFLIPCDFPGMEVCHALADLGASINLMPLSIWKKLSLPELTPTRMTLELADMLITHPKGVAEDVFVKVGKFHFLTDFVVVDFEADPRVSLILGRSFLRTGRALIDVYREEITLRVNDESVTFNLNQTMRYSSTYDDNSVNRVDVIDIACEEFVQDVLDFQYNPKSSNPPEGDILFLEKLLNEDPFQLPPMDLKLSEESKAKSSDSNKLPVIIAKDLKDVEKEALMNVLKSHQRAIAWKIFDIKGIDPRFCTHKILMEDDYKPAVQSQRRVNPKIHDVIKKEVIKLLDAGMIYPISDSPWVSPIHCVPKKKGITVVANENNELIPTRLVTGYFQIPIDPQDQKKTTFTYPYGTFAYRGMPFGLCNAPGHKISKSGIEVDRAKVDVIAKLPHPTTVKGVRSFDRGAFHPF